LSVDTTGGSIRISVANSVVDKNNKPGGIGLENLKNQLEYLYGPKCSMLVQSNMDNEFKLTLTLPGYGKN
jgi:sensor histidine kinase YesM